MRTTLFLFTLLVVLSTQSKASPLAERQQQLTFISLGNDMAHIEFIIEVDRFRLSIKAIEFQPILIEGNVYQEEGVYRLVPDDDFAELSLSLHDLLEWNETINEQVQVIDARTFIVEDNLSEIWICGILCKKDEQGREMTLLTDQ